MKKFLAVVKHEYKKIVLKWSFLIGTLLFPIIAAGFAVVPALIFSIKGEPTRIVVFDRTGKIESRLKESFGGKNARTRKTSRERCRLAIARHERLTGTTVEADISPMPPTSLEMRACIYRIVQEALNNAVRHAGGLGQGVRAEASEERMVFTISDEGPGVSEVAETDERPRLGLLSARHRAQTFGGTIVLDSRAGHGTRVIASFPAETTASLRPERDADKRSIASPDP